MKITEVAFVGYPVTNISRARGFYEGLLQLPPGEFDQEIEGMPGKRWIEYDLGNTTLAISDAWEPAASGGPTVALEVDDLDSSVARLKKAGVTFQAETMETPYCRFALLNDPDGNGLMLHQRKPKPGAD